MIIYIDHVWVVHRPGRLDRLIEVGLPSAEDRLEILGAATRRMSLGSTVELGTIAEWPLLATASGAALVGFCRDAAFSSLREHVAQEKSRSTVSFGAAKVQDSDDNAPIIVEMSHFEQAYHQRGPSQGLT